jgi:hypothetical protein
MNVTHIAQLTLAVVAAGAGAAIPFVTGPAVGELGAVVAISLAVAKVLGVQSETAGDKKLAETKVSK